MVIKINLMPGKNSGEPKGLEGQSNLFAITLSIMIVVILIYSGTFVYKNFFVAKKLTEARSKNESLSSEIATSFTPEMSKANKRLTAVGKILDNHFYWSYFYEILESLTIKDITYGNFSGSVAAGAVSPVVAASNNSAAELAKVKVVATASSFKSLARQLAIFRENSDILTVDFSSATADKDGKINFDLAFQFDPLLIKFKKSSPCIPYGDLNNDEYVTAEDKTLVKNYVAKKISFTDQQKKRADVTADQNIDDADTLAIGQYVSGATASFIACSSKSLQ